MAKKIEIPTFDAAMDAFEAGGEKAAKREEAKLAKYNQLTARSNDLKMRISKQQTKLKQSFFDASIDTVQLHLDLEVLKKEFEVVTSYLEALFPDGLSF